MSSGLLKKKRLTCSGVGNHVIVAFLDAAKSVSVEGGGNILLADFEIRNLQGEQLDVYAEFLSKRDGVSRDSVRRELSESSLVDIRSDFRSRRWSLGVVIGENIHALIPEYASEDAGLSVVDRRVVRMVRPEVYPRFGDIVLMRALMGTEWDVNRTLTLTSGESVDSVTVVCGENEIDLDPDVGVVAVELQNIPLVLHTFEEVVANVSEME
jgi:hypothetical protein